VQRLGQSWVEPRSRRLSVARRKVQRHARPASERRAAVGFRHLVCCHHHYDRRDHYHLRIGADMPGEDSQPNENRLARKGSTLPPLVRSSRPPAVGYANRTPQHRRDQPNSARVGGPAAYSRAPVQYAPYSTPYPPPTTWRSTKRVRNANKIQFTIGFPDACRRGVPGSQNARKEWLPFAVRDVEAQRGVKMVAFTYLDEGVSLECIETALLEGEVPSPFCE
jgi:hypothetical protein